MDRWEWPCALQGTGGNMCLSLDGWNPRRYREIVKFALRNSSALLEPRDVSWKICWLSVSPCLYKSADPNPAVIQGPWKCKHSFGQPTSTDLTNWPNGIALWFHNAWHLHIKNSAFWDYVRWIIVSGRSPSFHCLRTCISWSSNFFLPLWWLSCPRICHATAFNVIHVRLLVVQ